MSAGFVFLGATDTTVYVDDMPVGTRYADYFVEAENAFGESGSSDIVRVFPALRTRSR